MTANAKGMVMAAFAADALALGGHWADDTQELAKKFGSVGAPGGAPGQKLSRHQGGR